MLVIPDLTNLNAIVDKVDSSKLININNLCKMKKTKFILNDQEVDKCFTVEYRDKKTKELKLNKYCELDQVINFLNTF